MAGDESGAPLIINGSGSKWVKISAEERVNGISGAEMRVRVTLRSPANADFNLFVYGAATADCDTSTESSELQVGEDAVDLRWGEGAVANGKSDTKDVFVKVVEAPGACNAAGNWELTFEHF
jgi:hypothetical protein